MICFRNWYILSYRQQYTEFSIYRDIVDLSRYFRSFSGLQVNVRLVSALGSSLRTALWSFVALVLDNGLMKPGLGLKAKSYTDTGIGLDSAVLCNHTVSELCLITVRYSNFWHTNHNFRHFPHGFWQFLWAWIIDFGLDSEAASLGLDTPDIDPGLDLGVEAEVFVKVTAGLQQVSTVWHFSHSWNYRSITYVNVKKLVLRRS